MYYGKTTYFGHKYQILLYLSLCSKTNLLLRFLVGPEAGIIS